ncbi:DUF4030 domain-containing protein [Thermaerobacillus caldiproteolyticus]|uniref:DUF4179 domain-containing protein n=1 Tax=Thermaerobacillus caldiproteolyticus TaxID=247480 RepID=A0A7W0BZ07_9BACL|nr:DUF4030 domain-containing protein [Anoxybacillus caldiproteolyticus]MBA2876261.1 hypothetical protein [Anoxybacillus caldiproteolyticus]
MNDFLSHLKKEADKISIPEKELNDAIQSAILKGKKKKWSLRKKIAYFSGAAVLLFGLFIGSAFISPTMAEVASKIPYLNQLFESKPIIDVISEELRRKYNIDSVGIQLIPKKKVEVAIVGTEEYYNDVKDDVEKTVKDILASRNYDAFTVNVYKQNLYREIEDPKQLEFERQSGELMDAIYEELEKYDFTVLSVGVRNNDKEKLVELDVPNTEPKVDEIKKVVQSVIESKNIGAFPIKIHKIDMEKREQEARWRTVIKTIAEGLMSQKEYKVKGVGYSNHPSPMTITIKTTVSSSDPEARELGNKIEKMVVDFINSKEAKKAVKDDPYKIIVYSKDKKELN